MKKFLILTCVGVFLAGCGVNPQKATSALNAQGITDVKIGGWTMFGCSDRDPFKSTFTGVGQNGMPVQGVVCSGFLKGITIRYW